MKKVVKNKWLDSRKNIALMHEWIILFLDGVPSVKEPMKIALTSSYSGLSPNRSGKN
jgi:hypothetical protein